MSEKDLEKSIKEYILLNIPSLKNGDVHILSKGMNDDGDIIIEILCPKCNRIVLDNVMSRFKAAYNDIKNNLINE